MTEKEIRDIVASVRDNEFAIMVQVMTKYMKDVFYLGYTTGFKIGTNLKGGGE